MSDELKDLDLRVVDVDTLPTGILIDRLVARHVMCCPPGDIGSECTTQYSSDQNAVGDVVRFVTAEKRSRITIQIGNFSYSTIKCYVCIQTVDGIRVEAWGHNWSELPLAICRAALKQCQAQMLFNLTQEAE